MSSKPSFYERLRRLSWISVVKTVRLNFSLLPFRQAIRFPILITRASTIASAKGRIKITCPVKTGLIRFGFNHSDLISWKSGKVFINIKGTWVVNGWIQFGVGTQLNIDNCALMQTGNSTSIGANSKVICREKIIISDFFRSGWDVQIFDTNFHYVKNMINGNVKKRTSPVIIGKNNWVANRVSIMQGCKTNDYLIIASNSLCNKDYSELPHFSMVAGSPAKLCASNVYRVLDREEKEIDRLFEESGGEYIVTDISHL